MTATAEPPSAQAAVIATQHAGRRWPVFRLAFVTSFLTVLTAGLYRFWGKTRLRRYYWSAIRPGGWPLEYVGLPGEKLLGFLMAVTFLAFYLGVVNLLLMFASYSLLADSFAAYLLSFLGLVPVWFFARYRARRYILSRTRWRGIRFGMQPGGAWGYSWRAMGHWLVTLLSLGLLWPRMTFWLEKYRTDRTLFGTQPLRQGGGWAQLYRGMVHLILAVLAGGLAAAYIVWTEMAPKPPLNFGDPATWKLNVWAVAGLPPWTGKALIAAGLVGPWLLFGIAHYRAHTFAVLTSHKTIGDVRLSADPSRWRLFWIMALGNLSALAITAAMAVAAFALLDAMKVVVADDWIGYAVVVVAVLAYFTVFVVWAASRHAFVTLPIARYLAGSVKISDPGQLARIGQRERDELTQAEGMAEALDVGAAI